MLDPRKNFAICKLGSDVYLIGGDKGTEFKNGKRFTKFTNSVQVFNLCSEEFRVCTNLPNNTAGFTADVLDI